MHIETLSTFSIYYNNNNNYISKKKRLIKKDKAKRKKTYRKKKTNEEKENKSESTGLTCQTWNSCHESLIIKQKKFNIKKLN